MLDDRNLDAAIDLRADDVEPTELEGFHRIEYGLWIDAVTDGLADVSAQLVTDVACLQQLVDELDGLQPFDLANGAVGLLDEAASRQDHRRGGALLAHRPARPGRPTSRVSEQAFAYLEEGLTMIDPDLVATIKDRFVALQAVVEELADPSEPSGFILYDTLTTSRSPTAVERPPGRRRAAVPGGRRRSSTPDRRHPDAMEMSTLGVLISRSQRWRPT